MRVRQKGVKRERNMEKEIESGGIGDALIKEREERKASKREKERKRE